MAQAHTEDSDWRNRTEFFTGREAIKAFLNRRRENELDYRLMKELWCFAGNRISVRFEYEWHDSNGQWYRTHGNDQVTDAFPWDEAPRHLIRDRAFGPAYTGRIRTMRIRDHPTAARSPWQNRHVERLIGSIRREALDHLIVFDEAQLRRVLKKYASYYNQVRTDLSLKKDSPDFRPRQKLGTIAIIPIFWVGCIISMSGFKVLTKHRKKLLILPGGTKAEGN
jgi:hypothetical protein